MQQMGTFIIVLVIDMSPLPRQTGSIYLYISLPGLSVLLHKVAA